MKVLLATCEALPNLDEDGPALRAALGARGIQARAAVWSDPAVDWGSADLVLIRSTWDYVEHRDAFVAWCDAVEAKTRLANPAAVIRWNTDKRYLSELARRGVPVVPTELVEPTTRPAAVHLPAGDFVIKPAISAGCKDTARYTTEQYAAARSHLAALLGAGRTTLVQPYIPGIEARGETALVFFAGRFSHAIHKGPMLRQAGPRTVDGLFTPEDIVARTATAAEIALGVRALSCAPVDPGELLYARVDVVPDAAGDPMVLELELTEPSLFLGFATQAADALATAVGGRGLGR